MFGDAKPWIVTLVPSLLGLRPENQTSFYIMPRATSSRTSTLRRYRQADKILSCGVLAMRPCSHCVSSASLCVVSNTSEKCEQCHRFGRPCDLASPWVEFDRLQKQSEDLQAKAIEAEAKAHRLRKQRRVLLKKMKALGDREEKNIEEMEADEASAEVVSAPVASASPGPTSPTGLSLVSFGSFGRTSPVPSGSA
jgi:hypothetical protein